MVYTAVSVLGTFSFAAAEPFRAVKFEIENKAQGKIFGLLENFFAQHPAEEPVITTKLGSTRFYPLRPGFQRAASLAGLSVIGTPYSKSSIIAGIKIQHGDFKNNILLKLRI
jgi:hypothetical protein